MLRSLSNRLAIVFFAITFVAIGGLYLYIAPGLETRLINEKLSALAKAAQQDRAGLRETIGGLFTPPQIRSRVDAAALASGDRVSLFSVAFGLSPSGPQLTTQADSSNPPT